MSLGKLYIFVGVRKLLRVAAMASCIWSNTSSSIPVNKSTRMDVSVALSKLYDSLGYRSPVFVQNADDYTINAILQQRY